MGDSFKLSGNEFDYASSSGAIKLFVYPPEHTGYAIHGNENVTYPGKGVTFSSGYKATELARGSNGVTIIEQNGDMYHKKVLSDDQLNQQLR